MEHIGYGIDIYWLTTGLTKNNNMFHVPSVLLKVRQLATVLDTYIGCFFFSNVGVPKAHSHGIIHFLVELGMEMIKEFPLNRFSGFLEQPPSWCDAGNLGNWNHQAPRFLSYDVIIMYKIYNSYLICITLLWMHVAQTFSFPRSHRHGDDSHVWGRLEVYDFMASWWQKTFKIAAAHMQLGGFYSFLILFRGYPLVNYEKNYWTWPNMTVDLPIQDGDFP